MHPKIASQEDCYYAVPNDVFWIETLEQPSEKGRRHRRRKCVLTPDRRRPEHIFGWRVYIMFKLELGLK